MASAKIKIRRATAFDAVNIGRLLEQVPTLSDNKYPPINPHRLIAWVTNTIAAGYVAVAEREGRIVGSLGLGPYQYPWSDTWLVANEWMFVKQEYRKGGTAERLMDIAAKWCDTKKIPIIIGVQDILDAELKDRFLSIDGFVYAGGIFLRWPVDELSNEVESAADEQDDTAPVA